MSNGTILVTGGAGYIGSHVVRQLGETGEKIVVIDNLGRGFRQAVTAGELVVGDVGDFELVSRLLAEHRVDTVMHFAAHTIVPESVAQPLKYYRNNTSSTRTLLQACLENDVKQFRLFVDGGGVRNAGPGVGRRGLADAPDQCLWHLQTHERVDAARRGRGRARCATWPCGISTWPGPTLPGGSGRRRRAQPC